MKKLLVLSFISVLLVFQAAGQWQYNGTHIYNTNSGYVGIGTSNPSTLLYVAKNMTEPNITVRNLGGTGGATYTMTDDASGANWKFKATLSGGFKIRDHANGKDVIQIEPNSTANAIYIKSGGNVGIRTPSPAANLHVAENAPSYTAAFGTPVSPWQLGTNVAIGNDNEDAVLYVGQSAGREGFLIWQYNADPALGYFSIGTYNGSNNMTLQEYSGKVGVHTTNPQSLLDVHSDDYQFALLGYSSIHANYIYHSENESDGDGQTGLYVTRSNMNTLNDGYGYADIQSNTAIRGYNFWGTLYSFGTTGYCDNDFSRCGGVLGGITNGTYWGSLGYKDSGSNGYGGYFTSYTSGSGKSGQAASINLGIGAWGDLMGANIHGKVYGTFTEGENYALYSHGVTYKDNLDVHLQDNGTDTKTILYTNTSTEVTVQTSGMAQLSNGRASIKFDQAFVSSVSGGEPIIVTVTPLGSSQGVYLTEISSTGCTIMENNAGKSNVTVNYIAIGKRAGYEQPSLPGDVIDASYVNKVDLGLHNDNDLQTNSEGLYYENGRLVVGRHPSTLPDLNKKENKPNEVRPVQASPGKAEAGRDR